jgi:WXG100 family type VII secretion target
MPEIKLNYAEAVALAQRMKTAAENFEANLKTLEANVNNLRADWSGNAADVMQAELREMNRYAQELQGSLSGLADFVAGASEAIRDTDIANANINVQNV